MGKDDIFAFDFDGVVCDSQGESSRSAFKALQAYYPEVLERAECPDQPPEWLLENMKRLRPVVETGYENILLERLMLEGQGHLESASGETHIPPPSVEEVLDTWQHLRDELPKRYGLSKEQLVEAFGDTRDRWIKEDLPGWLDANNFWKPVVDAVRACPGDTYVITTKQARFAQALLHHAGLDLPGDRLYGLGTGPKKDVLADLLKSLSGQGHLHFFEDRVETLEGICQDDRLQDVKLYLCSWGYNTPEQRARGEALDRVQVIDQEEFARVVASE